MMTLRRLHRLGAAALLTLLAPWSGAHAAGVTPDAGALMDWAERQYPQLFPGHEGNRTLGPYLYRFYQASGNYVGVAGSAVYILGPVAGSLDTPLYMGELSDFACLVNPASCSNPSPGTQYLGFYAEDAASNPEDPTIGAFVLNLPASGSFSGSMFFTYVGCQRQNVGNVSGTVSGQALSGTWSGAIDDSPQSGGFSATLDGATQAYAGTYTVDGGKQFKNLLPCIQYTIAPRGSFEMYAVGASTPAGFSVKATGRTLQWPAGAGAALTLVYVTDEVNNLASNGKVLWQTLLPGGSSSVTIPASVVLQSGKTYLAGVATAGAQNQRLAFGSLSFVAP